MLNKIIVPILSAILIGIGISGTISAKADSAPGDVIVTMGANLTKEQKDKMLREMNVDPTQAEIITVTNAEEHKYLDKYMPKSQIGSRAISSAKITLKDKGTGLSVRTHNINYVSDDMYINALSTAGVKDASIYITAPFNVSGTAALTGLIKAYETSTGKVIPEKQKQVANEEMVKTAQLADENGIGKEKAADLMTTIKEKIAKDKPSSDQEMRNIINDSANKVGINLDSRDTNKLVVLFNKIENLNINWNTVADQLQNAKNKITQTANSEEAKGFFEKLKDFFQSLVNKISSAL
ncbi:uncharacterized protein YpuA (DUF1002 family) [Scopulibacillus daqui]|uniref:Uncharacterized protein YpuA (DUF1002 family) n=1 Tax=Scopulibacillus daqui TaxID=1469162 RepID=A0ABS2PX77_9BACL|nr:DUF1002 domain-containing protein [Scopulibacillus daqui]MBM7644637.1 uncharacterized protein YpuA (DUF1002 family) [Scopulibacillus daqui]